MRISEAAARKLGLWKKQGRVPPADDVLFAVAHEAVDGVVFLAACKAAGLQRPIPEYRFHPTRRFRFDWAFTRHKIALEIQGGIYGRGKPCPTCNRRPVGAHSSINDMKRDMERLSEAAILGWRVLYLTPEQFARGDAVGLVRRAMEAI